MSKHHPYCEHHHCDINDKLDKLLHLGERLMTVIKDYIDAQNAFNDAMDVAVADIQADVKFLNDQIAALQLNQINPEDVAALDALKARMQAMVDKLNALDAMTPPAPPVA